MKLFDLTGKIAIVTGGNGGIGLGMARGLAQAGAAVAVAGRQAGKSATAVKELEALGARAMTVEVDVRKEASCRAMVQKVVDRFGRLDILVNNAGTNIRKRPEEYTLEEYNTVLETNLTSAFICSQAAYPHMVRAGGGKIINIGSMMSIFGAPFTAPYAASKGGIVQMTKAMATAWARENIQVNAVLPGWIDTDLTREGPRAGRRPARQGGRADARRTMGPAGRPRRDRRVLRERGVRLRHGHRHPRRRRLLRPGRVRPAAPAPPGARLRRGSARSALGLAFLALAATAAGQGGDPRAAMTRTVLDQLAAFRRDDWATAYTFASSTIQARFGLEAFRAMVTSGYAPIARSATATVLEGGGGRRRPRAGGGAGRGRERRDGGRALRAGRRAGELADQWRADAARGRRHRGAA